MAGLTSQLIQLRTTRPIFRVPATKRQAEDMLRAAYMAEVSLRGGECRWTKEVAGYIDVTAEWITEQRTPGLLLCGTAGNGKTTLMRAIADVYALATLRGDRGDVLEVRTVQATTVARLGRTSYDEFKALKLTPMLAIDDMGIEPTTVLEYGNGISPMTELLTHRYDKQLFTVVTTNLTAKDIRTKYGDRIADRFNEMMTVVVFKDGTFRKQVK